MDSFKSGSESIDITTPISLVDYGIGEIARRIAGVAAFLKNEYCQGELNKIDPLHGFMQSLHDRLINYGWPLVREGKLDRALMPGEEHIGDAQHVARAMHALAPFFEERAKNVKQTASAGAVETELAADLSFAAKYLTLVLAADCGATNAGAGKKTDTPDLTPLPTPPRTRCPAAGIKAPDANDQACESQSVGRAIEHSSDVSEHTPSLVLETDIEEPPTSIPTQRDERQEDDRRKIDPILCSNRQDSRAWFDDEVRFVDLIGELRQWRHSTPEDYCFIPSSKQHGPCHFCDAKPLGISALHVIAMQHPLDPAAVQVLDIDILRFVRLALWDWTNASAQRKLERESLEVVREEIRRRKALREEKTATASKPEVAIDMQPLPKTPALCGQNGAHAASFPPSFLDPYDNGNFEDFEAMYSPKSSPIEPIPVDIPVSQSADNGHSRIAPPSNGKPLSPTAECEEPVYEDHHLAASENSLTPGQSPGHEASEIAPAEPQGPVFEEPEPMLAELDQHDVLRAENLELRHKIADLSAENASLTLTLNAARVTVDPVEDMSKGERTDRQTPHPLQHLAGLSSPTSSVAGTAASDAEERDLDQDLGRHFNVSEAVNGTLSNDGFPVQLSGRRGPVESQAHEDTRRFAGIWDTAVLQDEVLAQDNSQNQSLAQEQDLPAPSELQSGPATPLGVQTPVRSGASTPASEEDQWLAPLRTSTSQSLRSSRGRTRIEDIAASRHKWNEPKTRVPNRVAMLRNLERIIDALKCNKDKDKDKLTSFDLNSIPVQRESQLRVREV